MTRCILAAIAKLRVYANLVMFSHSIFSFSFTVLAALTAARGIPSVGDSVLLGVAFLGGRTCANALNRYIDRHIDARNPRTAARHLPAGIVAPLEAALIALVSFGMLSLAAFFLDPLCVLLLPLAGVLFVLYSFTKRFTWLCHIILGVVCAGAPAGAWIALRGSLEWPALILCAANALWVAGFDIVYAIADIDFDRVAGLKSIPARFGSHVSLLITGMCHASAVAFLVIFGFSVGLGISFFVACGAIAALLIWALREAVVDYQKKALFASYSANQLVSIVLLAGTAFDFLLRPSAPTWPRLEEGIRLVKEFLL